MKAMAFRLASAIFFPLYIPYLRFHLHNAPYVSMLHFCSCTPISFRLNPKSLPCQNLERFGRAMAKADLIVRIALTCSTAFQAAVHRRCCPAFATSPEQIADRVRTRLHRSIYQDSPTYAIRHQAPPSIPNGATISANDWFLKMVRKQIPKFFRSRNIHPCTRGQGCHWKRVSEASHIRSEPDGSARDLGTSRRI
jgi:hypothetical protein